MGNILVKKFFLSRSGVMNYGQDAMACNFANGRFAVADGVTNSFHPEIVAQALCNAFVDGNVGMQEWEQHLNSHILDEVSEYWAEKVDLLTAQVTDRQRRHIAINRESLPMGSSTFAGIECNLEKKLISYCILGDSSLFLIPQEGEFSIVCSSRREKRNGRQYVIYDNTPACISNFVYNCQGKPRLYYKGQWEKGDLPIVPGYVVLLTDGAAQWLQDALIINKDAIEYLWNIKTEKAFIDFVSEQREQNKMDDDLTIYILKIDSETNDGFEEIIAEYKEENVTEVDSMNISGLIRKTVEEKINIENSPNSLGDRLSPSEKGLVSFDEKTASVDNLTIGEQPEKEVNIEDMKDSCIRKHIDEEFYPRPYDIEEEKTKQNILQQENNIENQDISQHEKKSIVKILKRIIVKLKNKLII